MIGVLAVAAAAISGLLVFTVTVILRAQSRYPVIGQRVEIGSGAIHVVETAARGEQRAVVLLVHGASGNFADLHVALAERLAERGFRVFAVDRPGHGWSDRLGGREASSPERQAEWIRAALGRLGVDQAIVVVHSLAGVLGLAMALDAPAFTRGLVLLAPVSHPWEGGVSWYYNLAAARGIGLAFRWLIVPLAGLASLRSGLAGVFSPGLIPPDYVERTRLPLMFRPWTFRANAEDVADIEGHIATLRRRYREIRVPTTILTGDRDGVVYAHVHSTGCAAEIPGATLRVLEGVGHSPHFAAPEAVIEAILEVDRRAESRARPSSQNADSVEA